MQANILIIEDEEDIARLISLYLKREGFETTWCVSGEEGLEKIRDNQFDLLVLDINLPGIDGFETLQKIRKTSNLPVLILSARREDADMLIGFGGGADDYVTKPFSPGVLTARIRAHLNRIVSESSEGESSENLFYFGEILFDPAHYILKKENERIDLSRREMDLLLFLTRNRGQVYSKEQIYKEVWGNEYGDISTVTVHMQRLRKKIEINPAEPKYLKTKYGYGYYLSLEENDEK
ncbi:MAG: response regulator transcription factor [Spirochaetaceae bacterium]|jgi:DNA-binding response OmpR family regulator|nr:response regulator transcription factor [Spirochaetaceae bacterium]